MIKSDVHKLEEMYNAFICTTVIKGTNNKTKLNKLKGVIQLFHLYRKLFFYNGQKSSKVDYCTFWNISIASWLSEANSYDEETATICLQYDDIMRILK